MSDKPKNIEDMDVKNKLKELADLNDLKEKFKKPSKNNQADSKKK